MNALSQQVQMHVYHLSGKRPEPVPAKASAKSQARARLIKRPRQQKLAALHLAGSSTPEIQSVRCLGFSGARKLATRYALLFRVTWS